MPTSTRQPATSRRTRTSARGNSRIYIEGNTAKRLQELPERKYGEPVQRVARPQSAPGQRSLSKEAQRNRAKANNMSLGIVCFISALCVAITFGSVHYVKLKAERTDIIGTVASLEAELAELKEDNDAYESQVKSNVDMSRVKKIAIGRLGMKYPSDEQTILYSRESGSYVRQYQDIPESK